MSGVAPVSPKLQFSSAVGVPMSSGTLTVYLAGTTTPTDTWQDEARTSLNSNPITLDSRGECLVWLNPALTYKFLLKNVLGVTQWTVDNIKGAEPATLRAALAASSGSTLIGVIQAGSGAVARTLAAKLEEIELTPEDFGAVGDGATNDRQAMTDAVASATLLGLPLVLKRNYLISCTTADHPIELDDGAHIIFRGGKITYSTFGVPLFWNQGGTGSFVIDDPHVIYTGTATTSLPAINATFYANLSRGAYGFAPRDVATIFGFYGTRGVEIRGTATFESSDLTGVTKCVPRCITVGNSNTDQRAVVSVGNMVFDGVHFGLLAWGYETLRAGDVYSDHWGQLDTATYTWEAPAHAVYCTPTTTVGTTIMGDLFDLGTMVSGSDSTEGSASFKFTAQGTRLKIGSVYSERSTGFLDFDATNFDVGPVFGKSSAAADFAANKMLRMNVGSATVDGPGQFGPVYLQVPSDATGALCEIDGNRVNFHDWTIVYDGTAIVNPLIYGVMADCAWDLRVLLSDTQSSGAPTIFRVDDGGDGNRFNVQATSPQFTTLRVVENDKSGSTNNTALLTEIATGDQRNLAFGGEWGMRSVTATLSNVSGASVTATGLVPDGGVLIGLTSIITTALGTTSGTTGYTVGTGADVDRFGIRVGTAVNGGTDNSDWTAGTVDLQTAALDVIVTASGGNFDGTGVIVLRATYFTAARNADMA